MSLVAQGLSARGSPPYHNAKAFLETGRAGEVGLLHLHVGPPGNTFDLFNVARQETRSWIEASAKVKPPLSNAHLRTGAS